MALTLNATAGSATANSYATVAEADAYHERRRYADTWNESEAPARIQALVWATQLLDERFTWTGAISSQTQALSWPRVSAYDRNGRLLATDAIPQILKDATAELARLLLDSDRTADAESDSGAITALEMGPMKVTYASGVVSSVDVIPSTVVAMLAPIGSYSAAPGGGAVSMRRG